MTANVPCLDLGADCKQNLPRESSRECRRLHRPAKHGVRWALTEVAITNTEIAAAQWPGPPRNGDRCIIDGRTTTIQACDTRRLRNEVVLHLIQVRG